MKELELVQVEHNRKRSEVCEYIEPNITEDSIFIADGKPIGFYLNKMTERMCKIADVANAELLSKRVPKTLMNRVKNGEKDGRRTDENRVSQTSVILGSCPPRNHLKKKYASISRVHAVESAQTFIKSMLMLAKESEELIKQYLPEQYNEQLNLLKRVDKKWRFTDLFTSSISNYNISAPFHQDNGNIKNTVNVIICKKFNSKGGDLHVPDYGATIGQRDNSILVYPAWRNMHAVTKIIPTHTNGYRNSLIFYPLQAFVDL